MSVGKPGDKTWQQQSDEIAAAILSGGAIVCLTRCESCMFGCHYDEPTWHSWAGPEDIDHAKATGQPDPRQSRCGCDCAKATR